MAGYQSDTEDWVPEEVRASPGKATVMPVDFYNKTSQAFHPGRNTEAEFQDPGGRRQSDRKLDEAAMISLIPLPDKSTGLHQPSRLS